MKEVKLRFKNARRAVRFDKPLTVIERAILLRSDPHVHTEWQFGENRGNISFSATMMDGSHCCRFKQIEYSHPERWDTIILTLTEEEEQRAWDRAKELEGKPYDLLGLLSLVSEVEIIKPDPDKYWCNETMGELLIAAVQYLEFVYELKPDQYTPTSFFFEILWLIQQSKINCSMNSVQYWLRSG